eukprot:4495797-Amphidinium_carterae.3
MSWKVYLWSSSVWPGPGLSQSSQEMSCRLYLLQSQPVRWHAICGNAHWIVCTSPAAVVTWIECS